MAALQFSLQVRPRCRHLLTENAWCHPSQTGTLYRHTLPYNTQTLYTRTLLVVAVLLVLLLGTPPCSAYVIVEGLPAQHLVGNLLTDTDLSSKYEPDVLTTLRFHLLPATAERYGQLFYVEETTGALRTRVIIDRDTACRRQDLCTMQLDIAVRPLRYFEIIKVSVVVEDVNDNAPRFPGNASALLQRQVSEAAAVGAPLFSLPPAADLDSPRYAVHTYQLLADTDMFSLRVGNQSSRPSAEGAAGLEIPGGRSSDLQLVLNRPLDRELTDSYRVRVVARDGGRPPLTGQLSVDIKVLDDNDNSPRFLNSSYTVSVREDMATGQSLLRVSATDPDLGHNGQVVYSLSAVTLETHGHLFSINSTSGVIRLRGALDYETTDSYQLRVKASDEGQPPSLPAYVRVHVTVLDVNDHRPVITVNTLTSDGVASLQENQPPGSFVAHVSVSDRDQGAGGRVSCAVDSQNFRLRALPGSAQQYQLSSARTFDRERQDRYTVRVRCHDNAEPESARLSASIDVSVRIADVNDHAPRLLHPALVQLTVGEDWPHGRRLTRVNASDEDAGVNAQLTYQLTDGGDDAEPCADWLSVDAHDGVVRTAAALDYEQHASISCNISVSDGGTPPRTVYTQLQLNLRDVNDNPPAFTLPRYQFTIAENQPIGAAVGNLTATDSDSPPNDRLSYYVESAHADSFYVQPQTGAVRTLRELDRERTALYQFTVAARNHATPRHVSRVNVTVRVLDLNDNAPVITAPMGTVRAYGYLKAGDVVVQVRAHDPDSGDNARLTYSLRNAAATNPSADSSSPDNLPFSIESDTGIVLARRDLDTVLEGVHRIGIEVRDAGEPPLRTPAVLNILVNRTAGGAGSGALAAGLSQNLGIIIGVCFATLLLAVVIGAAVVCSKQRRRHRHSAAAAAHNNNGNNNDKSLMKRGAANGSVPGDRYPHLNAAINGKTQYHYQCNGGVGDGLHQQCAAAEYVKEDPLSRLRAELSRQENDYQISETGSHDSWAPSLVDTSDCIFKSPPHVLISTPVPVPPLIITDDHHRRTGAPASLLHKYGITAAPGRTTISTTSTSTTTTSAGSAAHALQQQQQQSAADSRLNQYRTAPTNNCPLTNMQAEVHEMLEMIKKDEDSESGSVTDSGRGPSVEGENQRHSPLDDNISSNHDTSTSSSDSTGNTVIDRTFTRHTSQPSSDAHRLAAPARTQLSGATLQYPSTPPPNNNNSNNNSNNNNSRGGGAAFIPAHPVTAPPQPPTPTTPSGKKSVSFNLLPDEIDNTSSASTSHWDTSSTNNSSTCAPAAAARCWHTSPTTNADSSSLTSPRDSYSVRLQPSAGPHHSVGAHQSSETRHSSGRDNYATVHRSLNHHARHFSRHPAADYYTADSDTSSHTNSSARDTDSSSVTPHAAARAAEVSGSRSTGADVTRCLQSVVHGYLPSSDAPSEDDTTTSGSYVMEFDHQSAQRDFFV